MIVDDWIEQTDSHFIAHRGLSSEAPENTIKSFELAGKKVFYAIETDIWLSKDGEFIVSHDGNLSRMCGVNKKIEDLTLKEIKNIPITSGSNYNIYKSDKNAITIPTLKEFLEVCNRYNIIPMIEIKFSKGSSELDDNNELFRLYQEIYSTIGNKEVYVISFHENNITCMNNIRKAVKADNMKLCLLLGQCNSLSSIQIYQYCIDNNIGFSIEQHSKEDIIKKMISDGAEVGLWTVDDTVHIRSYIGLGVDFIVTDKVLWK